MFNFKILNKEFLSSTRNRYIKSTIFILLCILLAVLLWEVVLGISLVLVLFIASSLSLIWKRLTRLSLGIELFSFLTIILSLGLGSGIGIIFGTLSVVIGYILANRLCYMMLIPAAGCIFVCVLSPFFGFLGVVKAGILLNIIYNLFIHIIYVMVFRFRLFNSILSFSLNFLLNVFLFSSFGEFIFRALA